MREIDLDLNLLPTDLERLLNKFLDWDSIELKGNVLWIKARHKDADVWMIHNEEIGGVRIKVYQEGA